MEQVDQQTPAALRARLEFPIWHRGFARAYAAWSSAPSDLKTPLLLSGPALAKAESWLLACPERLSDSEKRYIVRSISQRARTSPLAGNAGAKTVGRIKRRRATDRSLWQLYAVIAVGLWVFAPDYIKGAMEAALNVPDLNEPSGPRPMVVAAPNRGQSNTPAGDGAAGQPVASAPDQTAAPASIEEAGERAPGAADSAETAPEKEEQAAPTPAPTPPRSRSERLAELAREHLDAGQQRHALLLAMEAVEVAREDDPTNATALRSAAGMLNRAMATRTPLAALSTRVLTASPAMFCDGARGLLAATQEGGLASWQLSPNAGRMQGLGPSDGSLAGIAIDRECRRFVTSDEDFNVEIRPIGGGKALPKMIGHEGGIVASAFSPDGHVLLTASEDATARLWDARTGRMRALLSGHEWQLTSAAFSFDGRRAITASADQTARIWDVASGRELHVLDGHRGVVTSAAFSQDGRSVLTTSWDGKVRLWDARTGKLERLLPRQGGGALLKAWISPDGGRIATIAEDETVQIWETRSAEAGGAVTVARQKVRAVVFAPGSRLLAVLTWAGEASLHDVESGASLVQLVNQADRVRTLSFGHGLLHGISEAGVHLTWPLADSPEALLAQARSTAPACLSIDERLLLDLEGDVPGWCKDLPTRGAILPR